MKLVKQTDGKAGQGAKGSEYPPGPSYSSRQKTAAGLLSTALSTRCKVSRRSPFRMVGAT
jgi:hypothetical protein